MVFVREGSGTGYRSIVYKIYLLVEWAVANVDARFVLKTDDDAYIDCPKLVEELRALCRNPDCLDEKLYLGEYNPETNKHAWLSINTSSPSYQPRLPGS